MIDQSYRTGSVTAFMPLWLLMALAALPVVLPPYARGTRRSGRPGAAAGRRWPRCFMTGGVMAYGYLAHRYTSEFVPALVLGSTHHALGAGGPVGPGVPRCSRSGWRRCWSAGGLFSMAAQASTGLAAAAVTYRGEPLSRFLGFQDELSGGPGTRVRRADQPLRPPPDRRVAPTTCTSAATATACTSTPATATSPGSSSRSAAAWSRSACPGQVPRASVDLFVVHGKDTRTVFLQTFRDGTAQVGIRNETGVYYGPLFRPYPGEEVRVGMRSDPTIGYLEVSSTPGGFVGYVPIQEWYADWVSRIGTVDELVEGPTTAARAPRSGSSPRRG